MEQGEPDPRFDGEKITDRVGLEESGPLVPSGEELAERVPDQLRLGHRLKTNLVAHLCIWSSTGDVLDEHDGALPTDQLADDWLNILLRFLLPSLPNESGWDSRQAEDDEPIFMTLVDLNIGKFGIDCNLQVDNTAKPTVVLLESNHPILKQASRLRVVRDLDAGIGVEVVQDVTGGIVQVKHELQP